MNSPWNSDWLPRIAADILGREKRVPASTVHTVTDSHHGRTIPSQPGIAPPPATCPIRASAVAIVAATPPRTRRRGSRLEDMPPFWPTSSGPRALARELWPTASGPRAPTHGLRLTGSGPRTPAHRPEPVSGPRCPLAHPAT